MKLSKTLVLPIAAILLVGAAGAVMATTGSPATDGNGAAVPAAETASSSPAANLAPKLKDTLLGDTLDKLVAKGTITAAQKTAILDALAAERTARQTARQAARQQLKDFLADGVITQDELNKLPAESPIRKLTTLMEDGKITIDELRGLGRGFMGKGGGHGWKGNGGMFGAPDASPSTSS